MDGLVVEFVRTELNIRGGGRSRRLGRCLNQGAGGGRCGSLLDRGRGGIRRYLQRVTGVAPLRPVRSCWLRDRGGGDGKEVIVRGGELGAEQLREELNTFCQDLKMFLLRKLDVMVLSPTFFQSTDGCCC